MLLENPGYDRGRYGMLARLRGLAVAFFVFMLLTFTIAGFISGMLLMAESFDDTRKAGVDAWNSDVRDWNTVSRANFEEVGSSLTVNGNALSPTMKDETFEKLMENDSAPDELLRPDELFYQRTEDISDIQNPVPGSAFEVIVGGHENTVVHVPLVFVEVRCRYVQRGKMSRQVCDNHYFVLQRVCIKVDAKGVPTRVLDQVKGASTDVGCYLGTEGMFQPRLTHIWSPGIYEEHSQESTAVVPSSVEIELRSNTDPALTASVYTAGYYSFGQSPASKFQAGLILFIITSILLCGFMFMCTLQYIWPTAPSYSDRMKYFYRRYLRHAHVSFNERWTQTFGGTVVDLQEVSGEEVLLEQQATQPDAWQGPREGGHRLGGAMPPLVQSV